MITRMRGRLWLYTFAITVAVVMILVVRDNFIKSAALEEANTLLDRCQQKEESLAAQLQVVYEHKARVEKSLQQERDDRQKVQEDLNRELGDEKTARKSDAAEAANKYESLQRMVKMWKGQHDELQGEFEKLTQSQLKLIHDKSELETEVEVLRQNVNQMQADKDRETADLKNQLQSCRSQNQVPGETAQVQPHHQASSSTQSSVQKSKDGKEMGANEGVLAPPLSQDRDQRQALHPGKSSTPGRPGPPLQLAQPAVHRPQSSDAMMLPREPVPPPVLAHPGRPARRLPAPALAAPLHSAKQRLLPPVAPAPQQQLQHVLPQPAVIHQHQQALRPPDSGLMKRQIDSPNNELGGKYNKDGGRVDEGEEDFPYGGEQDREGRGAEEGEEVNEEGDDDPAGYRALRPDEMLAQPDMAEQVGHILGGQGEAPHDARPLRRNIPRHLEQEGIMINPK